MPVLYNIRDIHLGRPTYSGHEIYLNAIYHFPPGTVEEEFPLQNKQLKVIYKKNKYGNPQYSRLEVAFSQLARLFLANNLTTYQRLVVDDNASVVGLVSQHLCYVIERKEGLGNPFYTLDNPSVNCACSPKQVDSAQNIPIYFGDQLPPNFFAHLLNAEKNSILNINYASLASILTSSYTLEEDDLHKGNLGFYIVDKQGKPEVVFFKIDHDLMFADSIMSFYTARPLQLFNDGSSFDITAEDILCFPYLRHSANTYWPTKLNYLAKPCGTKQYRSEEEINAFAHLQHVPAFRKAKWMAFYKHILVPPKLMELSLSACFDEHNAIDRSQLSLIIQATIARQARLRAMLFSLGEFRSFVSSLTPEEKQSLLSEVLSSATFSPEYQELISLQVDYSLSTNQMLCQSNGFTEGDTPLHAAIKLGDFRYEETMQMFGHLVNKKNQLGLTPLDVALQMVEGTASHPLDVRKDLRLTMKYLLKHGAKQSDEFKSFNVNERIESYQFHTPYMNQAECAQSYQQIHDVLREIGEDQRYCLKFKKNLAIQCIKLFIQSNHNLPHLHDILMQLKNDVNGRSSEEDGAGLKYIRQLRSRLWIIRQIRGLFGWTSTQGEINTIIDNELERAPAKVSSCFSFFSGPEACLPTDNYSPSLSALSPS